MIISAIRTVATYVAVSLYVLVAAPIGMLLAILLRWKSLLYVLGHIGVRLALGASARHIAGMVARRVGGTLARGLAAGLVMALIAVRGLQSVLFGVTPLDPTSISVAVLVVVATGLLAAWWPATSVARVDPAVAIREA